MELNVGYLVFIVIGVFVVIIAASAIRTIQQSTVGIIERLGKFHSQAQRGINFVVPFIDRLRIVIDLREQVVDFPPQAVITKDNVTMQIDTVIYFQVTDPVRYIYEIADPISAIENLSTTTLRNIIGEMDLDATLTSRDVVNTKLRAVLDEATDRWGIKVNRVELKNIVPPKDIQESMEKQMRAERERREIVLRAEGEKTSSILRAEGAKQAAILNSEGEKEAEIRRAEGQRQSQILQAEGEAQAILAVQQARAAGMKMVFVAIKESDPTKEVVALRSLEALEKMAQGPATKLVLPTEALGVLGALAGAKEIFTEVKGS